MKFARVVAREKIYGICDDFGLKALDGYYGSPYFQFDDKASRDEMGETLCNLYDKDINKLINPNVTIEVEDYKSYINLLSYKFYLIN